MLGIAPARQRERQGNDVVVQHMLMKCQYCLHNRGRHCPSCSALTSLWLAVATVLGSATALTLMSAPAQAGIFDSAVPS